MKTLIIAVAVLSCSIAYCGNWHMIDSNGDYISGHDSTYGGRTSGSYFDSSTNSYTSYDIDRHGKSYRGQMFDYNTGTYTTFSGND